MTDRTTPTTANYGSSIVESTYADKVNETVAALWDKAIIPLSSVAGTDTITAVGDPVLTAYATGNHYSLIPANTNTGTVTVNIDTVGAKAIVGKDGAALSAGELVAGNSYLLEYDGASFRVLNPDAATGASAIEMIVFAYQQPNGTNGGTPVAATRTTYPLNTEVSNSITGATTDTVNNTVSLPAGTYKVSGAAEFFGANACSIFLRNTTDGSDQSGVARSTTTAANAGKATLDGIITLASAKTLSLEYNAQTAQTGNGLGAAVSDSGGAVEQYGYLIIEKV